MTSTSPPASSGQASSGTCDLLITGATIIDGSGGPETSGDVALKGGRIAAAGDLRDWRAAETVDASGLTLAPGFIDVHTHDDRLAITEPGMACKISQGVTTVVAGNCGVSLAPFTPAGPGAAPPGPMALLGEPGDYKYPRMADYAEALEAAPPALNVAMLTGHTTLRAAVMGQTMDDLARPATGGEIDRMADLLTDSLTGGAIGLSTGLAYPTAIHAPRDEVIELARRLKDGDALYCTHMRNEGETLLEALDETIETAEAAGVATVISHHKCVGRPNWGKSDKSLAKIKAAQARMRLDFDVYPYTAGSTILMESFLSTSERTTITWSAPHPEMTGRDFDGVVAEWGCSVKTAVERLSPAGAIYFRMDEKEVRKIMAHPGAMIGSDGLPVDGGKPHPRLWGTFPRVLGRYCRETNLYPLTEGVHRMTGKPAAVFGLKDRGVIREGAHADLVLFDAETVIDMADFDEPERPARGVERVMVAGETVWRDMRWTGARPGGMIGREV